MAALSLRLTLILAFCLFVAWWRSSSSSAVDGGRAGAGSAGLQHQLVLEQDLEQGQGPAIKSVSRRVVAVADLHGDLEVS